MPTDQTRLQVLADTILQSGGVNSIETDVRVITATHQNLENRVKDGLFRRSVS